MAKPSPETIRALGMHLLGRLADCQRLKVQAWTGEATGTLLYSPDLDTTLYNQWARASVYHSDALDKKKAHALQAGHHTRSGNAGKSGTETGQRQQLSIDNFNRQRCEGRYGPISNPGRDMGVSLGAEFSRRQIKKLQLFGISHSIWRDWRDWRDWRASDVMRRIC